MAGADAARRLVYAVPPTATPEPPPRGSDTRVISMPEAERVGLDVPDLKKHTKIAMGIIAHPTIFYFYTFRGALRLPAPRDPGHPAECEVIVI